MSKSLKRTLRFKLFAITLVLGLMAEPSLSLAEHRSTIGVSSIKERDALSKLHEELGLAQGSVPGSAKVSRLLNTLEEKPSDSLGVRQPSTPKPKTLSLLSEDGALKLIKLKDLRPSSKGVGKDKEGPLSLVQGQRTQENALKLLLPDEVLKGDTPLNIEVPLSLFEGIKDQKLLEENLKNFANAASRLHEKPYGKNITFYLKPDKPLAASRLAPREPLSPDGAFRRKLVGYALGSAALSQVPGLLQAQEPAKPQTAPKEVTAEDSPVNFEYNPDGSIKLVDIFGEHFAMEDLLGTVYRIKYPSLGLSYRQLAELLSANDPLLGLDGDNEEEKLLGTKEGEITLKGLGLKTQARGLAELLKNEGYVRALRLDNLPVIDPNEKDPLKKASIPGDIALIKRILKVLFLRYQIRFSVPLIEGHEEEMVKAYAKEPGLLFFYLPMNDKPKTKDTYTLLAKKAIVLRKLERDILLNQKDIKPHAFILVQKGLERQDVELLKEVQKTERSQFLGLPFQGLGIIPDDHLDNAGSLQGGALETLEIMLKDSGLAVGLYETAQVFESENDLTPARYRDALIEHTKKMRNFLGMNWNGAEVFHKDKTPSGILRDNEATDQYELLLKVYAGFFNNSTLTPGHETVTKPLKRVRFEGHEYIDDGSGSSFANKGWFFHCRIASPTKGPNPHFLDLSKVRVIVFIIDKKYAEDQFIPKIDLISTAGFDWDFPLNRVITIKKDGVAKGDSIEVHIPIEAFNIPPEKMRKLRENFKLKGEFGGNIYVMSGKEPGNLIKFNPRYKLDPNLKFRPNNGQVKFKDIFFLMEDGARLVTPDLSSGTSLSGTRFAFLTSLLKGKEHFLVVGELGLENPSVRLVDTGREELKVNQADAPDGAIHYPMGRLGDTSFVNWPGIMRFLTATGRFLSEEKTEELLELGPNDIPTNLLDAASTLSGKKVDAENYLKITKGLADYVTLTYYELKAFLETSIQTLYRSLQIAARMA